MTKRNPRPMSRAFDALTFRNMTIRAKFTLFSVGVSFWFLAIAYIGMQHDHHQIDLGWVIAVVVAAHVLLLGFTVTITRSLSTPVGQIIQHIRDLTRGDVRIDRHVEVNSTDEIGELSARFNGLLDTLHSLTSFRKVIEEDDSVAEVLGRLSREFDALALNAHQIYRVDDGGRTMTVAMSSDDSELWCSAVIMGDPSQCRAKKTGAVISSRAYPQICKQFCLEGRDHTCIPMLTGGSVQGVVQFVRATEPADPAGRIEHELRLDAAGRFLAEALPVIEAKRLNDVLRESAVRDPLTQLYNRRFLLDSATAMTALALRRKASLGVLMCDMDRFKDVNDNYGHDAGDTVLREFAGLMRKILRTSDVLIRYGGEEFVAVLQDMNQEEAANAAERLRAAVEEHCFRVGGLTLRKTISIGVAEFPNDSEDFERCISAADAALYAAKSGGRNQVVRYTPALVGGDTGSPDGGSPGSVEMTTRVTPGPAPETCR